MQRVLGFVALFLVAFVHANDITSAKVESCGGWKLNRLPEVINSFRNQVYK